MSVPKEIAEKYWEYIKPYIIQKIINYMGNSPTAGSYYHMITYLNNQKNLFIDACQMMSVTENMLKNIFETSNEKGNRTKKFT